MVKWVVLFHEDFHPEFEALPEDVQDELLAHAQCAPDIRPHTRPTLGRHPQRLPSREHERTKV